MCPCRPAAKAEHMYEVVLGRLMYIGFLESLEAHKILSALG